MSHLTMNDTVKPQASISVRGIYLQFIAEQKNLNNMPSEHICLSCGFRETLAESWQGKERAARGTASPNLLAMTVRIIQPSSMITELSLRLYDRLPNSYKGEQRHSHTETSGSLKIPSRRACKIKE